LRVVWLNKAVLDLVEIKEYTGADNLRASRLVAAHITSAVDLLIKNPGIGRIGRVGGTRELIVAGLPYIIPYRVKNERVEILRVFHTARDWPKEF
jgi:toxin ParE1/3/4